MTDDGMKRLAAANRVSIRAVLSYDGEDVTQALRGAGIVDPVAIPVWFGGAETGDVPAPGVTPHVTGVLEPDETDEAEPPGIAEAGSSRPRPDVPVPPAQPASGEGGQAFAPVGRTRRRGRGR